METQVKQRAEGNNFRTNGKNACWKGQKAEEEREGTHLAEGQKFVYCFRSYEFSSNGRYRAIRSSHLSVARKMPGRFEKTFEGSGKKRIFCV